MGIKPILNAKVLFVFVLLVTQAALADPAAELKKADNDFNAGRYSNAEQAYQDVITSIDPNKPEDLQSAFEARKKLPLVYLATDRQSQAQMAIEDLLARHAEHKRLPHAIHEIVEQAKKLDKTLRAGQVCQDILAAQPGHPQAIWLKMGIAITNVHLNNDDAVRTTVQNIIAQDADNDRSAEALGQIAWAYRKLNQPDKARNIYQYVVDNWPKKDRAIFSQRGLVLCSIALNDYDGAEVGLQKLLADFAGSKYIPEIVRNIAVEYQHKGKLDKALGLHEYNVEHFSKDNIHTMWSQVEVVKLHLQVSAYSEADESTKNLRDLFSQQPTFPREIYRIACANAQAGRYSRATELYR